jgi:hypothetical protein
MQFGLFYEWPNPTLRNWKLLFEEGVEQIQYSEALGFDYCLIRPYEGELEEATYLDRLFFDSPATVIEKFKRVASVGATHISNWMMFGGIEHDKLMRSIRLMGEEVIPALRDVYPPADLPDKLLHDTATPP